MMQKKRISSLITGISVFLVVLLVFVEMERARHTQINKQLAYSLNMLEMGGGELDHPVPTPSPKPEPDETPDPDTTDIIQGSKKETIVREETIVKEVYFPYENLSEGIAGAITDILNDMATGIKHQFQNALKEFQLNMSSYDVTFIKVMYTIWKITATIAGILMPLVLSIVVTSALKTGSTSIIGYAAARESLLNWVISIAAAASSYYFISKAIELSKALEIAIADGMTDAVGNNISWSYNLIERLLRISITPLSITWILGVFVIILIITLCGTIILSWFAIKVVILLATALAPIILIVGILPPFRWLQGLWLKVTTVALLLWPVNVLVIGIFVLVVTTFISDKNVSYLNDIFRYFIAVGVISILIGLNSTFGKLVYGAAIEVAGKIKDMITVGLSTGLNLAMIPLGGVAATGKIAGTLGQVGNNIGGSSHTGGRLPSINSDNDNTGHLVDRSHQQLNNAIASTIEATGLPGSKGIAAGMRFGNAAKAHKQLLQNINEGFMNQQDLRGDLDINSAVISAREGFVAQYGSNPLLLAQRDIDEISFPRLADAGAHLAQVELSAMETYGNPSNLLSQMGIRGGNLGYAAHGYAREVVEKTTFRERAEFKVTSSNSFIAQRSPMPSAHDWMTADSIIWRKNFSPGEIHAIDAPTFHNLACAIHRMRTRNGLRYSEISQRTNTVIDLDGLRNWIKEALH